MDEARIAQPFPLGWLASVRRNRKPLQVRLVLMVLKRLLRGAGSTVAFLLLVLLLSGAARAAADTVEIVTRNGVHVFQVELALTDEQRSRGLMHRRELPEGRGMLFDFRTDQMVSMWMQNTYVSLDMIFIRSDGRITHIAEGTTPLSTRVISSNGPVRFVLEVVAGTARKFGIRQGDRVGHPLIDRR
jgi:uncharacterized membrane protein (UPF0127 family)